MALGKKSFLLEEDSELLVRRIVEEGCRFSNLAPGVFALRKGDNCGLIFVFNEDMSEILHKVEYNDAVVEDNFVIFSVGVNYFLINGKDIVALGSWFQNKVFLQKDGGFVKALYFSEQKPVFKTYKSVAFSSRDADEPAVFECLETTEDGKSLYEIFSGAGDVCFESNRSLSLEAVSGEWFRVIFGNDVVQHYRNYEGTTKFVKLYDGKDEANFDNAVLFFDEKEQLYKLYGFEAYQPVLWGEGSKEDVEYNDDFIQMGNREWYAEEDDCNLLSPTWEEIADEEQEKEEPKKETVSVIGLSSEENKLQKVSSAENSKSDVPAQKQGWFAILKGWFFPW